MQAQAGVIGTVRDELRAGRKTGHWMWFVFPQVAGLGRSPTAQLHALGSLDDALDYLRHPLLGARLVECTGLVLAVSARSAGEIFGSPDDLKFHSSMTLFGRASDAGSVFGLALDRFFGGVEDAATLERLR